MATLDVRSDLAAERDPFQRIMAAVEKLAPSEELVVIAPFEPVPLYSVMAEMGFGHTVEVLSNGGWKITFRSSGTMEQDRPPIPRSLGRNSRRLEQYRPTPWLTQRLYRPYVKWSLVVALTLGFTTGAGMLLMPALEVSVGMSWTTYTQAHGVAQIFGWSGLFLMGMAFHIVPRFRGRSVKFPWPQRAVLVSLLLGIALRFIGQTAPSLAISDLLLVTSGVSLALSICLFVVIIGQALRGGTAPHGPPEAWLWMSLLWSVVAVGLHLVTVVQMASAYLPVAPLFLNRAFVHAALVGFIGNFIFGISIRSLPAVLALPPSRLKLGRLGFLAMNTGVLLTILGWLVAPAPWMLVSGALLELMGFAAFTAAIRLYSHRIRPRAYALGAYQRYEWYVRSAYAWLLVAGTLRTWSTLADVWPIIGPPTDLAAPVLHVLALGFVTMMIMGMAARMLPAFEGAVLPLHGLMDTAFVLLNVSVLLRLGFGIFPSTEAWVGLAISGVSGTLSLVCFSIVVWRTLQPASRRKYAEMARESGQQQVLNITRLPGRHDS